MKTIRIVFYEILLISKCDNYYRKNIYYFIVSLKLSLYQEYNQFLSSIIWQPYIVLFFLFIFVTVLYTVCPKNSKTDGLIKKNLKKQIKLQRCFTWFALFTLECSS